MEPVPSTAPAGMLRRSDFPKGFIFGSGSSAFQYEGAHDVDGKGPSIWDVFLKNVHPDMVENENALDAIDHYNRYKEDVKIMKEMGLDYYRFSISWSRVLPNGRRTVDADGKEHGVNEKGIAFYNNLIDELLANDIQPNVTLYHWDLPQALEDEYMGFLSDRVVPDFADYADLCFREFGNKVKYWTTLNEPWSFSVGGYQLGTFAPGRGSPSEQVRQVIARTLPRSQIVEPGVNRAPTAGDPTTEPYIVSHNQLLAHAAAVKVYKEKYQKIQNGQIGIVLVSIWTVPYTDTEADIAAAKRTLDFQLGWFLDPLTFGDYPESMKIRVGSRLPKFTKEQSEAIKGSFDFLGLNYYTANYVFDAPPVTRSTIFNPDSGAICVVERDGELIGEQAGSIWLYVYPDGLRQLLLYVKDKYNNPPVYILENGFDELNDPKLSLWESLFDHRRVSYHYTHLNSVRAALKEGADVKGYYAWSLMDNLEWGAGFHSRFGLNFIDLENNLERYPKLSVGWYRFLLQSDA